ncbi:MAG: GGDEF domain-containing protein [Firmicutes bacterium]|nr:GGDEF domain-containing protein [Bacillota bacterium]
MKEFSKLKIVQLIAFLIVTIIGLVIVFTDDELYQMIGFYSHIRILCIILWVALGLSFIFIFLDYRLDSQLRRENEELNYAFYTDPDTGVANRNSCDAFIDQYTNKILPEGMAVFTVQISNLKEINDTLGYEKGDAEISAFADILQSITAKGDFLGRNGGDKFIIILKKCNRDDRDNLISRIHKAVDDRNTTVPEEERLQFHIGAALQVECQAKTMHNLVAISDRRAMEAS